MRSCRLLRVRFAGAVWLDMDDDFTRAQRGCDAPLDFVGDDVAIVHVQAWIDGDRELDENFAGAAARTRSKAVNDAGRVERDRANRAFLDRALIDQDRYGALNDT